MLTIERVEDDYNFIKNKLISNKDTQDTEYLLALIELLSTIAYNFNFKYVDEDIEDVLSSISSKIFSNTILFKKDIQLKDKFIFYDCFAYDNRGLTQQYIRAFREWKVPFLFILENDKTIRKSDKILSELKKMDNVEILIVSSKLTRIERAKTVMDAVIKFNPNKVFLHMSPWDTVGNLVWTSYTNAKRYQINLTDHAFWLGKKISDYVIEFRSYGYNISSEYRNIEKKKLLIQPYYPIASNENFINFPVDTGNKTILFTGGSYYKMYGEGAKFFELLKNVLLENENTILFIAGSGNRKFINDFINTNFFQKRVFLIGDRKDINEIFKHIDIYIATYPITGALMAQFAAINMKNILAYTDKEIPSNFLDELIETRSKITYTDEKEFLNEMKRLVNDRDYRVAKEKTFENSVLTEGNFNMQLWRLVNTNKNILYQPNIYEVSTKRFSKIYIDAENESLKQYGSFYSRFFVEYPVKIPVRFYKYIFEYIYNYARKRMNDWLYKK